jgi:hypothetical protein
MAGSRGCGKAQRGCRVAADDQGFRRRQPAGAPYFITRMIGTGGVAVAAGGFQLAPDIPCRASCRTIARGGATDRGAAGRLGRRLSTATALSLFYRQGSACRLDRAGFFRVAGGGETLHGRGRGRGDNPAQHGIRGNREAAARMAVWSTRSASPPAADRRRGGQPHPLSRRQLGPVEAGEEAVDLAWRRGLVFVSRRSATSSRRCSAGGADGSSS